MKAQTAFALAAILLAFLGGAVDSVRRREQSQPSAVARLAMNRLWHRLQGAREILIGLALSWALFDGVVAVVAAVAVYAALRWAVFDETHNVIAGQPPLYAGEVADTDGWLRRLPPGARLAVKLGLMLVAATVLHHATA